MNPPAVCIPCRNDYHDACDSTAWEGETPFYFPAVCDCWAETHVRCERCGYEGPDVTDKRACDVAHCDGTCLTDCRACTDDMKGQGDL